VVTVAVAMFVSFMSFLCFDILMLWPNERTVYLRDQRSGMYCTSAFYIARSCAEAPIHILSGILGGVITFYMYGMGMNVWVFSLMSGLVISTAAAIFMAVSSVSKTFEQSNQLAMPILSILFLFSGFFVPATKIPTFWEWVPDVNFLYYSVNYLVVMEVQSLDYCDGIANATGHAEPVDCDMALLNAGFDPTMTFMDVIWNMVWTNLIFRVIAYYGESCCKVLWQRQDGLL